MSKKIDVSKSTLNIHAAEFVPSGQGNNSGRLVTDTIKSCVRELSEDPGEFNEIIDSYLHRILTWLDDLDSTERLVIGLTDLCIQNSNCRYIGVKLAKFIHGFSVDQLFLNSLLRYCKTCYENVVAKATYDKEALHGYTIYIGELYVQMELANNSRSPVLRELVLQICLYLLSVPEDKNILLLVNLLKLVGQSLQVDTSNELDRVVQKLQAISNKPETSSRLREAILKIIKTHEDKWGLMEKGDTNNHQETPTSEATLYGPDGQILSPEEQNFLDSCLNSVDGR